MGDATGKTGKSQFYFFYKMVNGLVPPYLSAIVPCNFENIHDYNTRQAVSIHPVRTRTTLYNNSFLPSTVRIWNSEPTSIRDSKSPSSLKSYYKSKCIKKNYLLLLRNSNWTNPSHEIMNCM